ncbi:hypothetical protein K435DRAFT_277350 [Dendrothele bispora CBS 962.96]|uniref:F-box domain-containing protein n=1 Tax=Dendrothele bispora (strain CBS 962.96) TaxID=1314807 RepID=A0A4S8LL16_DENBC|nr:hypothetical protein K435DRAFT_277350 [Dendrothele bispora CBS 962.96]
MWGGSCHSPLLFSRTKMPTITSRPLPRSLTELIPPETYDQILSHLRGSRSSLISCCLVCKAWLPASRHWLFSTSKVTVLRTNANAFLELVNRRNETFTIIPLIQHLILEQGGSHRLPFLGAHGNHENFQFDDVLCKFDGLVSLRSLRLGWIRADIGPRVPIALRSNFHSLSELELNSVVLTSVQQFFDILGALPNLEILSLFSFSFGYEVMDGRVHTRTMESTPPPPPLQVFHANIKESVTQFLFTWLTFHGMSSLHTVAFGLFSKQTNEVLSDFLRESGTRIQALKIRDAYTAEGIDLSPCVNLRVLSLGWICLLPEYAPGSVRFATEVMQTIDSNLEEVTIVIRLEKGEMKELDAFDWKGLTQVLQKPCFKGLKRLKLSVSGRREIMTKVAGERLSTIPQKMLEVVQWTLSESHSRW